MAKKSNVVTGDSESTVKLPPLRKQRVAFTIVGISPLIQHKWGEKALSMIRAKHAGKKSKNRDVRDPGAEGRDAMYTTPDGKPGIPAMALKSSIVEAAHNDMGIAKKTVQKALFFEGDTIGAIIPLDCDDPVIQEDIVRVGQGFTDLRYRPYFYRWSVDVSFVLDIDWLQVDDLLNLVDRAGFGIGIGEWRPEKGGEFGRFQIDRTKPVTCTNL